MMSVTHGVPQNQTCLKLVHGFIRINNTNNYYALRQIATIISSYYPCSIVRRLWQISKDQIPNKQSNSINGPKLVVNDYEFITRLIRNDGRLYFNILYQGSKRIQNLMYHHFAATFNQKIANTIVDSFDHIIKGQELDEILADLDDMNESFILAHVEEKLLEEELLDIHQIPKMKEDIVNIVEDKISFMFNYDIYVYGQDKMQNFRKLHRFNTIQMVEQATNMVIAEDPKEVKLCLQIFDEDYVDGVSDEVYKSEVRRWDIAALNGHQLMQQANIIYLDNVGLFNMFIKKVNGSYCVYLQQYKPNHNNALDPMMVVIDELKFCIDNVEVWKLKDFSVKADKYVLCGIRCIRSRFNNMIIAIKWH